MICVPDQVEWSIKRDCCVNVDGQPADIEAIAARYLNDHYANWHVHGIRVGARIDRGVYAYYPVESQCSPRYPMSIGGSNLTVFRFALDARDSSALSSSL